MRAMPYRLEGKGVVELTAVSSPELWKKKVGGAEPTSVLDTRRSPSPPTSTSTNSCGGGGGGDSAGVAAVSDSHRSKWLEEGLFGGGEGRREEWPSDLHPIPGSLEGMAADKCGLVGLDDCWDDMLAGPPPSPPGGNSGAGAGQELPYIRWFPSDMDEQLKPLVPDASAAASASFGLVVDPAAFGFDPPPPVDFPPLHFTTTTAARLIPAPSLKPQPPPSFSTPPGNYPVSLPPNLYYNQSSEPVDEKPAMVGVLTPQLSINQHQSHPTPNQSFFLPLPLGQPEPHHILLPPNPKRHHPEHAPTPLYSSDPFFRKPALPPPPHHIFSPNSQHQFSRKGEADGAPQAAAEQLGQAAEMVEAGNSVNARGILARLNHQLSTPAGKHPFLRAAFYFKEALQLLLDPNNSAAAAASASPLAVVFRISAYKAFSEVSPVLQFANFTSDQALLEATAGFHCLHVIDFDIALGGQWASFMKELAVRGGGASPSLKITAVVSADADVLELGLTRENLSHFAAELSIPFDFRVAALDSFDASAAALAGEAVAVNLPVLLPSGRPAAGLLRLVKQLNPKLVVSLDRGADQTELSFAGYFAASLRSHAVLLDSLDAVNVSPDAVQKIERFLVGPRIEKLLAGRHCSGGGSGDRQLPWRSLFAAAGLSPVPFSSFTEKQAEYLVNRLQMKGFHLENKQSSLCLCWQKGELVSVSAWRF